MLSVTVDKQKNQIGALEKELFHQNDLIKDLRKVCFEITEMKSKKEKKKDLSPPSATPGGIRSLNNSLIQLKEDLESIMMQIHSHCVRNTNDEKYIVEEGNENNVSELIEQFHEICLERLEMVYKTVVSEILHPMNFQLYVSLTVHGNEDHDDSYQRLDRLTSSAFRDQCKHYYHWLGLNDEQSTQLNSIIPQQQKDFLSIERERRQAIDQLIDFHKATMLSNFTNYPSSSLLPPSCNSNDLYMVENNRNYFFEELLTPLYKTIEISFQKELKLEYATQSLISKLLTVSQQVTLAQKYYDSIKNMSESHLISRKLWDQLNTEI
eukprot:TRINITY_DN3809_c2_g1_i2.p1 TRINITY_DN3809_c2_g1~~TRINITY_DN3809_c2_g1_i2.p1  ORF type:complete len:323 (+),score=49.20 TRINITY_DN3809_c2_g1_i2:172-1140(+)